MVFYNYILKCFVIIDLKRGKLNKVLIETDAPFVKDVLLYENNFVYDYLSNIWNIKLVDVKIQILNNFKVLKLVDIKVNLFN